MTKPYQYLSIVFCFFLVCQVQANDTVKLRILETTDIHMYLTDYDYYQDKKSLSVGLSRVASLIKAARNEVNNSVLVDNGDLLQGAPIGEYVAKNSQLSKTNIHPAYKAMNPLNYTVGNLGNHEFNFGLPFLEKAIAGANFPYISANVYLDDGDDNSANDKHFVQPYLIETLKVTDSNNKVLPINIGYIGFTPPQIMLWDMDNLKGKLIAKDIISTAEQLIPEMKAKGADIIIAIPHSGMYDKPAEKMAENVTYHLAQVKGIDAILFGHSHRVFPGDNTLATFDGVNSTKGTVFGVPAVMAGFWGSHLGIIDLTLTHADNVWSVIDSQSSVRAIAKRENGRVTSLVEVDDALNGRIKNEHQETLNYMRKTLGETKVRIHSYFALVRDDPSVQLVNNAQIAYVKRIIRGTELADLPVLSATAPFKSGGRIGPDYYTDIPAGPLSLIHLSDLYVYPNDLKVVKLTGAQVIEWLEFSAGQFQQINLSTQKPQTLISTEFSTFNFDIIDGITYQIDVTQPARYHLNGQLVNPDARRIIKAAYQGAPLTDQQEFLIATNNYRANGGGNFPNLDGTNIVINAPDKNRTVVAGYINSKAIIDPSADGNWQFVNSWQDAKVTFKSSINSKALAPKNFVALAPNSNVQRYTEFVISN